MMSSDDIIYFTLLLTSILIGYYLKDVAMPPQLRQKLYTGIGLLFIGLVSRWYILHPIALVTGILFIIRLTKKPALPSFVFGFGYLAFFRLTDYIGIPLAPAHTNAAMLFIVLRIVGVAYEIEDMLTESTTSTTSPSLLSESTDSNKMTGSAFTSNNLSDNTVRKRRKASLMTTDGTVCYSVRPPSSMEIIHYCFCFVGVLTGPYFRYRTYDDTIYGLCAPDIVTRPFLIDRLRNVPYLMVLVVLTGFLLPMSDVKAADLYERSLVHRVWCCFPIMVNYRLRMFVAFLLSEGTCIAAGLGGYPISAKSKPGQGPTDKTPTINHKDFQTTTAPRPSAANPTTNTSIPVTYDFETVRNVDVWNAEFCSTIGEELKLWNMTVQYWLGANVYHRVPRTQPRLVRMMATLFVSALWHGVYAGYYLFFLTSPVMMLIEEMIISAFRPPNGGVRTTIFDWLLWVFKKAVFTHVGVAFFLLTIDRTMHYWWSTYFLGHLLLLMAFVAAKLCMRSGDREAGRTRKHGLKLD